MNQILSTNMPDNNNNYQNEMKTKNKRPRQPVNTTKVTKVFAIFLCIFAIVMIVSGAYCIFKNMNGTATEIVKPEISIENKSDTSLLIKVTSKVGISKVSYGWNDEEKTIIDGRNRKYAEAVIDIPSGSNVLYVIAEDTNGESIESKKTYELDSNIIIKNDDEDGTIVITYGGNKTISYMTYRWDDQEETKVELNGEELKQKIDAIKGIHTLTVVVVDSEGNKETKVQKVKGTAKPTVTVEVDKSNNCIILEASDETALQQVIFKINDDDNKEFRIKTTEKEFQYKISLDLGVNKIEVTAYNSDNKITKVIKEVQ